MPVGPGPSRPVFYRGAAVAVSMIALPLAIAFGGVSNPGRAGAQAPAADLPAFRAAPSFGSARTTARTLGVTQVNAVCKPGPERITGHNVKLDLSLQRAAASINNPQTGGSDMLTLRTYNGCITSPAISARPGDTLQITLKNALPAADPSCVQPSTPPYYLPPGVDCFNTTNLHTHGLHVSPTVGPFGAGDNVQISIPPAKTQAYSIDIPADHPAGTFWYHAHQHGSTAVHVASALAGPLIIHGTRQYPDPHADVDTILHDEHASPFPDTTFVLQQIPYACFADQKYTQLITESGLATIPPPAPAKLTMTATAPTPAPTQPPASAHWVCPSPSSTQYPSVTKGVVENFQLQLFSPTIWDTNGRFTSINGVVQPLIAVPAGQIQRWRLIHAGIHDTINVQLVEMQLPKSTANRLSPATLSTTSIATALRGKTRREQASLVNELCNPAGTIANEGTLKPQFEIAADGLTRTQIREINPRGEQPIATPTPSASMPPSPPLYRSNYLQPGYRSDVLVVFPKTDTFYCVLDQTAPASERVSNGGGGGQGPSDPQLLAIVHTQGGHNVTGSLAGYVYNSLYAANPQLKDPRVRAPLKTGYLGPWAPFKDLPLPANHGNRHAYFFIGVPKKSLVFTVNGRSYDPTTIPSEFVLKLGATDQWTVAVAPLGPDPAKNGEPHIFHIHINPFEVMDVRKITSATPGAGGYASTSIFKPDGTCDAKVIGSDTQSLAEQYCGMHHVFRDTLFIQNGYLVTLRTRYDRYIGEFVIHCHILDHEDAGMMTNVEITQDPSHPLHPERVTMPMMHPTRR